MNLRQLETFVAVAEALNFTRAARRLCIAQPAVSQHVRALERQYGVRLFVRHARGVSLTPVARDLLPRAREILARLHGLEQALKSRVGVPEQVVSKG